MDSKVKLEAQRSRSNLFAFRYRMDTAARRTRERLIDIAVWGVALGAIASLGWALFWLV
jgi:hypothetical protein